jgi:hypothetical protein
MVARTRQDVERIKRNVEQVRKVSDRVIGLGPFGVGVDGLISLLNTNPITAALGISLNEIYTWGAGGWLIYQAAHARASGGVMARMLGYVAIDSVVSGIPFVGSLADLFFQGHQYAARALQREIDATHFVEASASGADAERHRTDMAAAGKRRLVFLHD